MKGAANPQLLILKPQKKKIYNSSVSDGQTRPWTRVSLSLLMFAFHGEYNSILHSSLLLYVPKS
jgi:hypothetical protein